MKARNGADTEVGATCNLSFVNTDQMSRDILRHSLNVLVRPKTSRMAERNGRSNPTAAGDKMHYMSTAALRAVVAPT